jgi:hypothetical protein
LAGGNHVFNISHAQSGTIRAVFTHVDLNPTGLVGLAQYLSPPINTGRITVSSV